MLAPTADGAYVDRMSTSRHQTGRAYARLLETIGYVVAVLGAVSGIITMYQVSFVAGLGYLLGAVVSGIGLVVLGEVVIVLFNIEYHTAVLREGAPPVRRDYPEVRDEGHRISPPGERPQ